MEELKPLADRMHEAANTLNEQEEKIFDFCLRHPKACQDYDACRQGR
jgi:DNA-binding MurR/RpiR family transcriptional regulator